MRSLYLNPMILALCAAVPVSAPTIPQGRISCRSFGEHRDQVTRYLVFAGQDPRGVFSYDPTAAGRIRWSTAPELVGSALIYPPNSADVSGRPRSNSISMSQNMAVFAAGKISASTLGSWPRDFKPTAF